MPPRTYSVTDRNTNCQRTVATISDGQGPRIHLSPEGQPWFYVQMIMGTVTGSVSLEHYDGICTSDMSYCRVLAILSGRNHATRRFAWGTLAHLGGGSTKFVEWKKLAARHKEVGGPHFGVFFSIDEVAEIDWVDYEAVFDRFGILAGGRFVYQANTRECDVGLDCRGALGEITNGLAASGGRFQKRIGSNLQMRGGNGWESI